MDVKLKDIKKEIRKSKNKYVTQNKYIKIALKWLKRCGIEYITRPKSLEGSFWHPNNIEIGTKRLGKDEWENVIYILSTIFHEYAHFHQLQNKMWKSFMVEDINKNSNTKTIRNYMRTALRAEKHADKLGARFMKSVFPLLPYSPAYSDKKDIELFKKSKPIIEFKNILYKRKINKKRKYKKKGK